MCRILPDADSNVHHKAGKSSGKGAKLVNDKLRSQQNSPAIIKGSPNDIYFIIEEPSKHYFTEKVSYFHLFRKI